MEVVGVDDFTHGAPSLCAVVSMTLAACARLSAVCATMHAGAANVPFLGDARLINGALTNATFLSGVFAKFDFDVVYHLPYQPGLAAAALPPASVYGQDLVRSPLQELH